MIDMLQVLLLNADWSPIKFVSDIRAIKLILKGRAETICLDESPSVWEEFFFTTSTSFQVPATIRLLDRASIHVGPPRFRKKILYNRDSWTCQYCRKKLGRGSVTIDHVLPRCKGGKTTWKNCVVSCKQCNKEKGNKLLHETNMSLLRVPSEPKISHFWDLHDQTGWHKDWYNFVSSMI
jgi:hypothetical protein